jgi:hypothetical protein
MRRCGTNIPDYSSVSPAAWSSVRDGGVKSAWGEDRVYFYNERQELTALPASWTDVVAVDPFVTVAASRAPFRANDLLDLAQLIHCLSVKGSNDL